MRLINQLKFILGLRLPTLRAFLEFKIIVIMDVYLMNIVTDI